MAGETSTGKVVIDCRLRNDQFSKQYNSLVSKLDALERKRNAIANDTHKDTLAKEYENAAAKAELAGQRIDELRTKIQDLKSSGLGGIADTSGLEKQLAQQEATADRLYERRDKAQARLYEYEQKRAVKLDEINAKMTEYSSQLDGITGKILFSGTLLGKVSEMVGSFGKRIASLALRAFVFNIISRGFQMIATAIGQALMSNNQFAAALGRLRSALLTAFAPIYNVIMPALTALVNGITAVISAFAALISALFGKSIASSIASAKALNSAGAAAGGAAKNTKKAADANKEYAKSLSGFDTIETIASPSSREDDSSASGGGMRLDGFADPAVPTWMDSLMSKLSEFRSRLKELLAPALNLLKQVWVDTCEVIQSAWAEHGQPILDAAEQAFSALWELLSQLYSTVVKPVFQNLITLLSSLWAEHLQPLWSNIVEYIAVLTEMILALWNEVVAPLIQWAITNFGPVVADLINMVMGQLKAFIGFFADLISTAISLSTNLLEFVKVFAAAFGEVWSGIADQLGEVWQGIVATIKGCVNNMIGFINGMLAAVVGAINTVIEALNSVSFNVPDWIPGLGGKKLGFSVSTVSSPQIPYLATGAVIPPNNPYLAVVGDQRSGTNIETPLETMIEAFQAAQASQPVNIRFTGDLAQLGRVLKPVLERESHRVGGSLITGGTL